MEQDWEKRDRHLVAVAAMPFQRKWPEISNKPGLYILRGPRQVGKTSWIKNILSRNAKQDASSCFYRSCENMRDHQDLAELFKGLTKTRLILLDEITFVKEWTRAVKHFIDSGYSGTLVITGSGASDLRRGADRMPGRWGAGSEIEMLPMDVKEFLEVRSAAGWTLKDTAKEIELFFTVGGFPGAVAEAGKLGKLPEKTILEFKRWLIGDINRLGLNEQYLREIMLQIALTHSTPISLQGLAHKTQIGSHRTALNYIEALEDSFALRTLYALDISGKQFFFRRDKKFYFTDPLIFHMALDWAGYKISDDFTGRMAELTIAEMLFRKYPRFGYLATKKGEIDFIIPPEKALEVKWSAVPENLSMAYKELKVRDKKVLFQGNFLDEL